MSRARIAYPFRLDGRGRTGQNGDDEYIRGLIEQVLLTAPGERVMRPTFGSGVRQLLFGAASPEVATATQYLVQGSLQQWLADLITVDAVDVQVQEGALRVNVRYTVRRNQSRATASIRIDGGGS